MTDHRTHDGARREPGDEAPDPAPARARTREFALVGAPDGARRVTHTAGYPLDPADLLPEADVLLLVADDTAADAGDHEGDDDAAGETGAMLFRYSAYGEVGGDTWHPTAADARAQAAAEYGDALQPWEVVPPEVADAHAFAVRYAAERLNDREGR
jgi:hypothetical protein